MDLGLKQKKVLITGGSRGIGKEIARQFLKEGAIVGIVGRTITSLEKAQQDLGQLSIYQADVTVKEERIQLIDDFLNDHQTVDVLINNAGGSSGSDVLGSSLDDFYEAFEYNYFPAVHLSQLTARKMVDQGSGSIVNITSVFGRESGGLVTYNNAKSALISFTKSLADEVVKRGVRVNSIAPGSVYHDGGVWAKRMNENPDATKDFIVKEIPAGRFGTPEEIAQAVVFLSSDSASWVSGACLTVDGGQSKSNI